MCYETTCSKLPTQMSAMSLYCGKCQNCKFIASFYCFYCNNAINYCNAGRRYNNQNGSVRRSQVLPKYLVSRWVLQVDFDLDCIYSCHANCYYPYCAVFETMVWRYARKNWLSYVIIFILLLPYFALLKRFHNWFK